MGTGLGPADWAAEFVRAGEVRIAPRRRVTALKAMLYGFLVANEVAAVVSAALGRQSWRWWPLFCVVAVPTVVPLVWMYARLSLSGRPILILDRSGVSLGRKRLAWDEITAIESPNSRRRRPSDPRRPVDASRGWFGFVTVVPAVDRLKRQISVGGDHVKDLEGLAIWLDALAREQQLGNRTA
ncbi:hypothetical protein [Kribbella sp. NPDC049584]|uniref:hypothetical protein n=1 Tax=Kribbella sp. NPDC049584 TaxID=3154833 RepID=UPI00341B175D